VRRVEDPPRVSPWRCAKIGVRRSSRRRTCVARGEEESARGGCLVRFQESGANARRIGLACALALLGVTGLLPRDARADLIVPAASAMSLASGVVDLACTDLIVGGTLHVDSGQVINVRHVTIQAGGTINGNAGLISLGGNWSNTGTFAAGTSTVRFRDACGAGSSSISGSTTFANASFVTATGKNYVFAVGTTQTVSNLLEIAGTAPQPIQFRSATPGLVAFINLLPGGTQQIQHVGVTDVWATGQWLAPNLTNEGGGGNANRWFGMPASIAPVPTLADAALAALALLLAAAGMHGARRRTTIRSRTHLPARGTPEGPDR